MIKEVCQLKVHVIPNARLTEIASWEEGILKVRLHALPEKGKANKELIDFLAKTLKLPKSSLSLIRGETSRQKTIQVPLSREDLHKIIEDQLS